MSIKSWVVCWRTHPLHSRTVSRPPKLIENVLLILHSNYKCQRILFVFHLFLFQSPVRYAPTSRHPPNGLRRHCIWPHRTRTYGSCVLEVPTGYGPVQSHYRQRRVLDFCRVCRHQRWKSYRNIDHAFQVSARSNLPKWFCIRRKEELTGDFLVCSLRVF